MPKATALLVLFAAVPTLSSQQTPTEPDAYVRLMTAAATHARKYGAASPPVLSPHDELVLNGSISVPALHAAGIRVIPWTTNDPAKMRQLMSLGVDGIISDRPDLLHDVVDAARRGKLPADERQRLATFDIAAHRGGRGLRPENTLPSFESGLDNLATTLETDTGVTSDGISLLWHDQFLNPESCRRADRKPYTDSDRVYIQDISFADAQRTFICDKLHHPAFPEQRNDLALSPVASSFARQEGLRSPYVPISAAQLFDFVRFYAGFYRTGLGRTDPHAAERAHNAEHVRFNLETKILPPHIASADGSSGAPADLPENHTVEPQAFVDALTRAILSHRMQSRSEIQSFDFRTLLLVEEQHPTIPTYYLLEDPRLLSTDFVPAALRQPSQP